MTSLEKHNEIGNILDQNNMDRNAISYAMLDELTEEELSSEKVNDVLSTIRQYFAAEASGNNKYPENIMQTLRQRRGLKIYDTSCDKWINNMSPDEALNEVCNWHGLIGYGYSVKGWVEAIYGISLDELRQSR